MMNYLGVLQFIVSILEKFDSVLLSITEGVYIFLMGVGYEELALSI